MAKNKNFIVTLNFDEKYYKLIRDAFDQFWVINVKGFLKNMFHKEYISFTGIDCSENGRIVYLFKVSNQRIIERRIKILEEAGILDSFTIERA